jgi:hypothetical protein
MIPVRVPPHSRRRIETGPASARDYRAVYAITRPCIFQPNELFDIVRSAWPAFVSWRQRSLRCLGAAGLMHCGRLT